MSGEYLPTIGLEIHAELKTRTKMFCCSKNDPDEVRPNVNVCPVCLAHPGTLPVINGEAVKSVLRVGLALGATLADYTEFDRKNYFYPDLPKGYQLSQYEYPLVSGGTLGGVSITRVHLEEDTASSIHDEATGETAIDYNRAGVPLMELVTEPEIHSAEEAGRFARELQLLLRYLDVSEANMEKGEMRVEANISVAKQGERGTKVEIKNLNSFNTMERAVRYEIERQSQLLEKGEKITQETRGWDEKKQATFAQRTKEGSADYRYFPDPDLPSLKLSELPQYARDALAHTLPELPAEKRARYLSLGIKKDDADLFVRDRSLGGLFDELESLNRGAAQKILLAANYIANDIVSILRARGGDGSRDAENRDTNSAYEVPISARQLNAIVGLVSSSRLSSRTAKDLLALCAEQGIDPESYAQEHNLFQEGGEEKILEVVTSVIGANDSVVADYKAGKAAALEYLVGQCMKQLRGAADAAKIREILRTKLS
jgi:aspartyl-tRNA(Asn)/glutamyl-tRNA(Gln) amidotransferase subunit B